VCLSLLLLALIEAGLKTPKRQLLPVAKITRSVEMTVVTTNTIEGVKFLLLVFVFTIVPLLVRWKPPEIMAEEAPSFSFVVLLVLGGLLEDDGDDKGDDE